MRHYKSIKIIDNSIEKMEYHAYILTAEEKFIFEDLYKNPNYLVAKFAFGVDSYQPDLADMELVRRIYEFIEDGFITFRSSAGECDDWAIADYLEHREVDETVNYYSFKEFNPESKEGAQLKFNFDTYEIDGKEDNLSTVVDLDMSFYSRSAIVVPKSIAERAEATIKLILKEESN